MTQVTEARLTAWLDDVKRTVDEMDAVIAELEADGCEDPEAIDNLLFEQQAYILKGVYEMLDEMAARKDEWEAEEDEDVDLSAFEDEFDEGFDWGQMNRDVLAETLARAFKEAPEGEKWAAVADAAIEELKDG